MPVVPKPQVNQMPYKILVVWKNGDEEYLQQGNRDAIFTSKKAAEDQAEFMRMGVEGTDSIKVVNDRRKRKLA